MTKAEKLNELKAALIEAGIEENKLEIATIGDDWCSMLELKIKFRKSLAVYIGCNGYGHEGFYFSSPFVEFSQFTRPSYSSTVAECVEKALYFEKYCERVPEPGEYEFNEDTLDKIVKIVNDLSHHLAYKGYLTVKLEVKAELDKIIPQNASNGEWRKAIGYAYDCLEAASENYYD